MLNLTKTYTRRFFAQRRFLAWRWPIICSSLIKTFGLPQSIIDFGCGNGDLLDGFKRLGVQSVYGIEGTANCVDSMRIQQTEYEIHDLRLPYQHSDKKFTLGLCLEVAEHLEAEYALTLVRSLCNNVSFVVFSAAKPGQEGLGHVNCQTKEYWIIKFKQCGFEFDKERTKKLKALWEPYKNKKGIKAYYQNILVFKG